MMPMEPLFICENCHEVFGLEVNDVKEATEEMVKVFGHEIPANERSMVCDDCYAAFKRFEKRQPIQ